MKLRNWLGPERCIHPGPADSYEFTGSDEILLAQSQFGGHWPTGRPGGARALGGYLQGYQPAMMHQYGVRPQKKYNSALPDDQTRFQQQVRQAANAGHLGPLAVIRDRLFGNGH